MSGSAAPGGAAKPAAGIAGLVPSTATDFPGRLAATVFLAGCNFRCPYCHNPELVAGPFPWAMAVEELGRWLEPRAKLLDAVCLSGGEPLLAPRRAAAVFRLARDLGLATKLDTNGSMPHRLASLLDEDLLDYVAVDIKASPCRYEEAVGRAAPLGRITETVRMLRVRRQAHELRTTVTRRLHSPEDVEAIGHWVGGDSTYVMQPFVPSRTLDEGWQADAGPTADEMASLAGRARVHFARLVISL